MAFKVYINRYLDEDGNIIESSSDTLMFEVPLTDTAPCSTATVKSQEDSADSFDFSMEPNSEYYDKLIPLKTRLLVKYDDQNIFYGRVLTINTSTVFQTKQVHCEGAYAFLNDSIYEATRENDLKKISLTDYLSKIFNNHNNQCSSEETWKKMYMGNIIPSTWNPVSETRKFEPSSWTETASLLSNLSNTYGGHFRVRRTGSKNYIDWYRYYTRDLAESGFDRPVVAVGKDILDISGNLEINNVFTYLIPIGSTTGNGKSIYIDGHRYTDKYGASHVHSGKAIPVTLMNSLYTNSSLNEGFHKWTDYRDSISKYGSIYKTQSFPNADTKDKLWNYAKDWIKNNYYGDTTSFSVKAIDLHTQDDEIPYILIGECVDVEYVDVKNGTTTITTRKLICTSVQYDLFSPENTNYTFSVPNDLLNTEYGHKKKTKSAAPITSSAPKPVYREEKKEPTCTFESIWSTILNATPTSDYAGTEAARSFDDNGEISGIVQKVYDPAQLPEGEDIINHPELYFNATIVGKITLPGKTVKWVAVSKEHGVFAFIAPTTRHNGIPVRYWYSHNGKDTYDYTPASGVVTDTENGEISFLNDGKLDEQRSVIIGPDDVGKTGQTTTSKGTVKVGVDLTKPSTWKVELNKSITYKDKNNQTVTKDGAVAASDFNLDEIPSFKTKMAVIDIVVANAVEANQIKADIAYIRKINSEDIIAGTTVRSQYGRFSELRASNLYIDNAYLQNDDGGVKANLGSCFSGATASSDNGLITITFTRAHGKNPYPVNFNMADTKFFQDEVAAAKDRGAAAVTIGAIKSIPPTGTSPDRKLNPGEWAKAGGTYTDKNGHTTSISSVKWIQARNISLKKVPTAIMPGKVSTSVSKDDKDGLDDIVVAGDADLIPANIKSGVTIFNVTGSYSGGAVSDIRISAPPISQYDRPSSATELSTWRNIIKDAYLNQKYLVFDVWLNGDSSRKTYYVNLG